MSRRIPKGNGIGLWLIVWVAFWACANPLAAATDRASAADAADSELPRHPLEIQALTDPDQVLRVIPQALEQANLQRDERVIALLHLAHANACRMVADWACQRSAGAQARRFAEEAEDPILVIRGLIAEARAGMSLQDYSRSEQLLVEAELLLKSSPSGELVADVKLAYSTLSNSLGKHDLARRYAEEGIAALAPGKALPMRVRLLRNLARALTLTEQLDQARDALEEALSIVEVVVDPKLHSELHLEAARLARTRGDRKGVQVNTARALELAAQLKNSQLSGLAHELLGLAAMDAGDRETAEREMAIALRSFRDLGLARDELRVVREQVSVKLMSEPRDSEWAQMLNRLLTLESDVSRSDRASASDDFDARLTYAEQALEMMRLEGEATLARERERALSQRNQLTIFLVLLSIAVVLVMAVYFAAQRRSNARLQQSLDARLRALTQTSHELRNPIGGVLGLSELLLKTPINAAQRSMVEAIRAAGATIEKLAQDLLDRGRIESGRLSLSLQPASLRLLAESLYQLHLPRAREKGLTLQLDLGPDLPDLVLADAERLQQVLGNLLGNSLKFTERGAINLSLRVRARSSDNRVRVSFAVRDTGPGIDPDDIERLFEPFAKGRAGQRHRAGAGLGLAISADLVRLMGGQIQVDSAPGKGAQFRFELTLEACAANLDTTERLERAQGTGLHVLMVDDDEDVALALRSQLEVLECEVDQAASAKEARARVAAAHYDLVLLDVELPDGNGPDLARSLRATEANMEGTRVAIISGHLAPKVLPPGVDEWLTKPVLLDRLNMLLATARVSALTSRVVGS